METKKLLIPNRAMQILAPISLYTTSQRQPLGSVLPGMITSPARRILPLCWWDITPVPPLIINLPSAYQATPSVAFRSKDFLLFRIIINITVAYYT